MSAAGGQLNRRQHDVDFVAFDLLRLDGDDLRDMALEERREIFHAIQADMVLSAGCSKLEGSLSAKTVPHAVVKNRLMSTRQRAKAANS